MAKFKGKKRKAKKSQEVKKVGPKTRKEIRKEKRSLKKVNKKEYFSKSIAAGNLEEAGKFVKAPKDIAKNDKIIDNVKKKSQDLTNVIMQENKGAKKREEKLKTEMKQQRNSQLLKANEEEDKIIKKLEKQLKLKKRKSGNISKSFAEDGLGYLLEVCDERTMQAAVSAEKHLAETGSGSDFEEDIAIAMGKSSVYEKNPKKAKTKPNDYSADDSCESDFSDENGNSDDDDSDDLDSNSDLSVDSEEEIKKSKSKININKKETPKLHLKEKDNKTDKISISNKNGKRIQKYHTSDSEEDDLSCEDMDSDEEMMSPTEEDDMDEELKIIYSGMSGFPDESFQPGNLTPVKEETEQELDLYQKNVEIPVKAVSKNLKNCIDSEDEEEIEEEEEEEEELEEDIDESMDEDEDMSFPHSDEEECTNPDCCKDDSDEEINKQIVVNGKTINTYGRDYQREAEPDIVKCPKLDKMLENLSSAESECEKSFEKKEIKKKKDSAVMKMNCKRKLDEEANSKRLSKKHKASDRLESISDKNITKADKKKKVSKEAQSDTQSDSDICDDDSDVSSQSSENEGDDSDKEDKTWEDIYGRKRDHLGNVVTTKTEKYIPPHLRAKKDLDDSKEIQQLKRQIKGLLNKVAGGNMHWTGSQLEAVYSSHSRHSVNSAFCSVWLEALVQSTTTSSRLAAEHCMLVAILHANVGSEVGSHFLQTLVKKFDDMIAVDQNLEDKRLDNLILAISYLYSFKIFQACLFYEILNKLLETISEKTVECTLVALRSVGGVLRKDDPAALKTFIQTTQERASKFNNESTKGSRVKFLLEILLAIKNNNMNKIPNYDPSYSEELKKSLKAIIRKGNYVVALNIKLEDLLKADERGKWWVVGSAWEGSKREEGKEGGQQEAQGKSKDATSVRLMELALQQRINTDLRRNIFCIIMSAEDYMDAFEKLQQLGLKNQQEREIIHIIIACCLQEKVYNPYYAVLAQKYCDHDRKFQMSIQYSVWDKLKEIDTFPPFQIANLGQFLTHLFIEKGLPISILKVVQFSNLTKSNLRLMRQILLAILLHKHWQICLEVFQRVAVAPRLRLFREGLRLFISHFLIKNTDKKGNSLSEEQATLLKERAAAVDNTLNTDSRLQF